MAKNLFRDIDASQEIRQHQIYMCRPIDEAKTVEGLEGARQKAMESGAVARPDLDRTTATFTQTENGNEVVVECVLRFSGTSSVFSIRPQNTEWPSAYGEAGWWDNYDKLKLIKTFQSPVRPEDVKAAFKSLLDDIDAALDAIMLELKQHNDTIEDQVDRLIEVRRAQLTGFEELREGLSNGL